MRCECFSVYIQTLVVLVMPVVSEELQLLCKKAAGFSLARIPVLKCFSLCEPRRGGWTGFSLHCGGGTFFSSSSLSWRESYVRGESLPTAPLCFCFSQ